MSMGDLTEENGYRFVQCSESWKKACSVLACFDALQWPGYGTKIVEDKIDGQDVVIQLWKGTCQKFLGLDSAPGGIGAEVGIYKRKNGHSSSPPPSGPLGTLVKAWRDLGGGGSPTWLPAPELGTTLTFRLTNPMNGKVFFAAGPQKTYWLCKWMLPDSYEAYRAANPDAPSFPLGYRLTFTVNGNTYPAWD